MHNGLIKVVTGIRRSGKSYLVFHLFRDYLLQNGVDEEHIIGIELNLLRITAEILRNQIEKDDIKSEFRLPARSLGAKRVPPALE